MRHIAYKERITVLRRVFREKAYFTDPYFKGSSALKPMRRLQAVLSVPLFNLLCRCFLKTYYQQIKNNGVAEFLQHHYHKYQLIPDWRRN